MGYLGYLCRQNIKCYLAHITLGSSSAQVISLHGAISFPVAIKDKRLRSHWICAPCPLPFFSAHSPVSSWTLSRLHSFLSRIIETQKHIFHTQVESQMEKLSFFLPSASPYNNSFRHYFGDFKTPSLLYLHTICTPSLISTPNIWLLLSYYFYSILWWSVDRSVGVVNYMDWSVG